MKRSLIRMLLAPSDAQLTAYLRRCAILAGASVPLAEVLDLSADVKRRSFDMVTRQVKAGSSLQAAFTSLGFFDEVTLAILAAGEATGRLSHAFEQAASALEQRQKLKRILLSASVYPIVVFTMTFFVLLALLIVIVPRFQQVFQRMDLPLPPATQKVFQWSAVVTEYWFLGLAMFFLLVALWLWCSRRPSFRLFRDALLWHVPLWGTIRQKSALARTMIILAHALETGVPLLQGLFVASRASGDAKMALNLNRLAKLAHQGKSFGKAARVEKLLPLWCVGLLEIGETTGQLAAMVRRIGEQSMEEQETSLKILTALLEPFMLVTVGLIVALVVWAIFSPVLSAVSALTL